MSQIIVQDKTVTTTQIVKSVEIESGEVKLNQSASFVVKQLDADGRLIAIDRVIIEGNDYTAWGNDDNYVVDFILNKLGLTEL